MNDYGIIERCAAGARKQLCGGQCRAGHKEAEKCPAYYRDQPKVDRCERGK